jgi:hypothetical protein
MFRKIHLPIVVGSGVVLLILILVLVSVAMAQEGNSQGTVVGEGQSITKLQVSPVPGGPGFISMSALAFKPHSQDEQYMYYGQALYNPGASVALYFTPVSLPHGATITKLVMYYFDNAAADLEVSLVIIPLDSALGGDYMATVKSSGAEMGDRYGESTAISYPIIDQQLNSYAIQVMLPPTSDVMLIAVRVDFAYQNQLPLINK